MLMFSTKPLSAGVLSLVLCTVTEGSALLFRDDVEGFNAAVYPAEVHEIDFGTLPDGSPTLTGAIITPDFNYTHLGVTFLPHHDPGLFIAGFPGAFCLRADSYPAPDRNWIIAELVEPGSAVGTYFASSCTLSAYGADGELLAQAWHGGGGNRFTGIVSDIPIAYATIDTQTSTAFSDEFVFAGAGIPEPSAGTALFLLGAIAVLRRRAAA